MSISPIPADADTSLSPLSYRTEQVAKILNISKQSVFNKLASGEIPGRKMGGITLILHSDLIAVLQALPRATYTLTPTDVTIKARDAERRAQVRAQAKADRVAA